jgi:hypothetical protein
MHQSKGQFDVANIVQDTAKHRWQCTGLLEKMNNLSLKTTIQTDMGKGGRAEDKEENEMTVHVVYMTGG